MRRATGSWWSFAENSNKFQSTLSLRRATRPAPPTAPCVANFNPRSPCGERRVGPLAQGHLGLISIHAILAESDRDVLGRCVLPGQISIHALLAESDPMCGKKQVREKRFQSTLSLRRATAHSKMDSTPFKFQSTLSLRRATFPAHVLEVVLAISIHALLAESDR